MTKATHQPLSGRPAQGAFLHRFANPGRFLRLSRWLFPALCAFSGVFLAIGLVWALLFSPADWQQGDAVRIMYLHVPMAILASAGYATLAVCGVLSLVWKHPLADLAAVEIGPVGAVVTALCLLTGAFWGKPMWGTWWDWDPRLTTELILLFLYVGVMGLYSAIEDRRIAARAAGLLAIVGVALLPVIHYSVVWWNSLHQGQTIRLFGKSSMDPSMVLPLMLMVIATKLWFAGSLLQRARLDNVRREAGKHWSARLLGQQP